MTEAIIGFTKNELELMIFALEVAEYECLGGESKELIAKLTPYLTKPDVPSNVNIPFGNAPDFNGWGSGFSSSDGLDILYGTQFVQNEEVEVWSGNAVEKITTYQVKHTPILAGCMTGVLYFGGTTTYTFVVSANGLFTYQRVGENTVSNHCNGIKSANLNLQTGELTFQWNGNIEPKVIVCYEYNIG